MLLLSMTTVRVLKALVGLVPVVVGGILVFGGLRDPTNPTGLILLGIGGVLVVSGGYTSIAAITRDYSSDG